MDKYDIKAEKAMRSMEKIEKVIRDAVFIEDAIAEIKEIIKVYKYN